MGARMRNSRLGAEPPVVRVWTGGDQDEPCPGSPPGRADWRPRGTLRLLGPNGGAESPLHSGWRSAGQGAVGPVVGGWALSEVSAGGSCRELGVSWRVPKSAVGYSRQ